MASANNQYSFVPDPHTTEYLAMNDRRNDRSTSPAGRKFWPFNRSRSSSPNTQTKNLQLDTSFNTTRSRKSSANSQNASAVSPSGSANSFVVRSVIRNPGGVSLPTSPANEQMQGLFGSDARQQSPSPGGVRRMTLEDSDDDLGQPQLQYRRSKSKPLGAASLGVPPGGPGGGVGYGTASSSNDGRPESAAAANQPSPYYRPASPSGSITAADFQRGAKERGRSPRKSISGGSSSNGHSGRPADQVRSGSAHSATSSSNGKKPVARITAGPKSLVQQQQEDHHHHHQQHHYQQGHFQQQQASSRGTSPAAAAARHAALSGPRQFPGGAPPPSAPGYHPHQHPHAPRNHSAGPSPLDQRGNAGFPLLPPQLPPAHDGRDESPSRSRRFSFGIGDRSRKDSKKSLQQPNMPGAAPLDGLPSPVDIPYGRSPHSPLRFDGGAETDYSRDNSPFGSVSPARVAGSPNSSGFLSTLMGRQATEEREGRQQQQQQQRHHHDDGVPRSCSPGGGSNLAGKWFKGVFGRSPRGDEKDPNYAADLSPYSLTSGRDAEDEAAYAQKLASMRQARHIVDEERQRQMMGPTTPTGRFDPNHDREFRPKQVVDSDAEAEDAGLDAALEFELGRKKSPPGRKPVPAYLPAVSKPGQEERGAREMLPEEPLTPAQRIIQETRSKQLAREQIEAQRKEALVQQQKIANPRETVAANAQFNGPPTPPKAKAEPNLNGHQQRFPSGAHQITREPAKGGAPASTANPPAPQVQQRGSTLSPGSGPMPADMPLRDALQEMMVRFYRFERYSVPLIRSLETRLLDIERDAMLSNNQSSSIASHNSAEMDRWVNQMTSLMKHEVGQLKAATREIKESRELVATVARHASASTSGAGNGVGLSMSVSSFGSLAAITPSQSLQQVSKVPEVAKRETNVSSSTFESAVPRQKKSNLGLPAGAKPMLGKDEGKHSPTKANFGFASESGKEHKENTHSMMRDRSVSPNGRPRYTSVLGQPLQTNQERLSPAPSTEASQPQSPGLKKDVSVEDRLKALMEGKDESRSRSASFASASLAPSADTKDAEDEEKEAEAGDESGNSQIAAALAAIDATSAIHEKNLSEHTLREQQQQHHVPVTKSGSNSSSDTVEEPLTPSLELGVEPTAATMAPKKSLSEDAKAPRPSALAYLNDEPRSASSSPIKTHFSHSPTPSSGRISPNKLFAHKFAATGSTSSTTSQSSPSASSKLGLVEKKRFTLPAPTTTPASNTAPTAVLGTGLVTTVQARNGGKLSRTPSYSLEDGAPTSAAFSGLAKVKPVGHTATLRERVAFFDAAK
ncbi:uncharacterized protein UTRI_06666 [Ustilago trichophora]|uniref:Uncharacterized protein n=1 Tax=Ustilago trichophora TaxID=86804 RepID=A0A5C3ER85_9BASI|nr:uncharacterized protein UTRI_06666 [Ustilago trichophora]